MQTDIPQEQLDHIQPLLDGVLTDFQRVEGEISLETDSALVFDCEPTT